MNSGIIRIIEIFDKINGTHILSEGLRDARAFIDRGLISPDDFTNLLNIDPTPRAKYLHWLVKVWVQEEDKPELEDLKNSIEKYDTLVNRGKIEKKDINQIKDFKELGELIKSGDEKKSKKEKANDYEVIIDNDNLLVVVPHNHESARMLGMKYFNFRYIEHRKNPTDADKDCAWCIAFKNDDHFNDYYHTDELTFYMIRVKSDELIKKIRAYYGVNTQEYDGIIIGVYPNGRRIGYTGLDNSMDDVDIKMYLKIIGLE